MKNPFREETSTERIEKYLPLLKKFAEQNKLEVIKIDTNKAWRSDHLAVEFKIK